MPYALQMRREPVDLKPFGNTAAAPLGTRSNDRHHRALFMAFEGFSNRDNANATPSSIKRSLRPFKGLRGLSATDSSRPDPDDKGIFARWIPLVLLLLALLPTVAVFLVVGGALVFR